MEGASTELYDRTWSRKAENNWMSANREGILLGFFFSIFTKNVIKMYRI